MLLDCIVTAVLFISVHLQKMSKLVNIRSHSNIKDGRKYTFSAYYALLCQER